MNPFTSPDSVRNKYLRSSLHVPSQSLQTAMHINSVHTVFPLSLNCMWSRFCLNISLFNNHWRRCEMFAYNVHTHSRSQIYFILYASTYTLNSNVPCSWRHHPVLQWLADRLHPLSLTVPRCYSSVGIPTRIFGGGRQTSPWQ